MTTTPEPFPVGQVLAVLAAALRGDDEGARLLVDLLPASQLRDAVDLLARMAAGAITSRGSATGDVLAGWLSDVLAGLEGGADL